MIEYVIPREDKQEEKQTKQTCDEYTQSGNDGIINRPKPHVHSPFIPWLALFGQIGNFNIIYKTEILSVLIK